MQVNFKIAYYSSGTWRKLHVKKCSILYVSGRKKTFERSLLHPFLKKAYRLFVGKPEGKKPLRRPRRRWVDNISMDLVEVGWGHVDRIGLAQDRDRWRALVNSVLNLRIP
jgi:hypothetical protein